LMAVAVLGSAIGQHHIVANLPDTKPPPFSLRDAFSEITEAFSEKAFLIFAAGGLAAYISQGMTFSISNFLNIYVWQLDRVNFDWAPEWLNGLTAYPFILGISVFGMFMIVGPMHNSLGKPKSATISALLAIGIGLAPYALFLGGYWPPIPSFASTVLFFGFTIFANMFGVVLMISATSMLAEIVEAFEERTGRRAEGSFYSGNWLVQKCATGFGGLDGSPSAGKNTRPASPQETRCELQTKHIERAKDTLAYGASHATMDPTSRRLNQDERYPRKWIFNPQNARPIGATV